MPFARDVYEMDFSGTEGAVGEFDRLLDHEKRRALLCLPGHKTSNLGKDERDVAAERCVNWQASRFFAKLT